MFFTSQQREKCNNHSGRQTRWMQIHGKMFCPSQWGLPGPNWTRIPISALHNMHWKHLQITIVIFKMITFILREKLSAVQLLSKSLKCKNTLLLIFSLSVTGWNPDVKQKRMSTFAAMATLPMNPNSLTGGNTYNYMQESSDVIKHTHFVFINSKRAICPQFQRQRFWNRRHLAQSASQRCQSCVLTVITGTLSSLRRCRHAKLWRRDEFRGPSAASFTIRGTQMKLFICLQKRKTGRNAGGESPQHGGTPGSPCCQIPADQRPPGLCG